MSLFGKPKTTDQIMKEQRRQLGANQRQIDREVLKLDRQEKQLTAEIRKLAASGQNASARTLAKELVRVRKQKEQLLKTKSTLSGVSHKTTTIKANQTMMNSMAGATRAMQSVNAVNNPARTQAILRQYAMENEKMDMAQEMMDDAFEDDEVDAEADDITNSVLEEIGIDVASKMAATPSRQPMARGTRTTAAPAKAKTTGDAELDAMLAGLV